MSSNTMLKVNSTVGPLDEQHVEESSSFDQDDDSWDAQIKDDLAAGRLDAAIAQALDDERNGRIRPL